MLSDKWRSFGQKWIESSPWYLAFFSLLYAGAVWLRNKSYQYRWRKSCKVQVPVVSIGNLIAGGTGKTPFLHLLASQFSRYRIAILSRGYGTVPDEALWLQQKFPLATVLTGRNRAKLAQQIASKVDLIFLDDGFQHRKLLRDLDIVLVRPQKEHYLPWGFLRDSPKRLKEADVVIDVENELSYSVDHIVDQKGEPVDSILGQEVGIFCAIARPERFRNTVLNLGAKIVEERFFADHAKIDLFSLPPCKLWICTEKDAVKLTLPCEIPIYVLKMQMQWIGKREKWENLIEKIVQKIDNPATYEP